MATVDSVIRQVIQGWRPPPRLSLSEWSDKHAFLSAESSAQEGNWRTLPYQKGIMDAMTDPTIEQVVVMKSARVGYTKILNNLIGYHIHHDPCPIMVVQPTIEDAEGYSKEEIAPMLRDTDVLRGLVADAKAKSSNNTILAKSFPGGTLSIVGANSPRGFRRVSRRIVLFDEIDGYPPSAGAEGDQISLGIRRSEYYWNRKIVMGSTPTIAGASRVETAFEDTDQRRFFVPCPHCNEFQYLKWSGIRWPKGQPEKAYYACEANGCVIEHSDKHAMIERGEWRATATAKRPGLIGFHIWAAYSYSPNATWGQLATEFLESKGDPLKLKTFINTVLGETWREQGEKIKPDSLQARAEDYGSEELPADALVLTAGIDVQLDRIEMEVVGWGVGEESWSIEYRVFYGDVQRSNVWAELDLALANTYRHPAGMSLQIAKACIDTGGTEGVTQTVYEYVKKRDGSLPVLAIKGQPGEGKPVIGNPTRTNIAKIPLFPVGTMTAKDMVFARLKIDEPGPGYCHFPTRYGTNYYDMLTNEEVRVKVSKGFTERYYWKLGRNEALDCRVYAYAALVVMNLNLEQIRDMIHGNWVPEETGRRVRGSLESAPEPEVTHL